MPLLKNKISRLRQQFSELRYSENDFNVAFIYQEQFLSQILVLKCVCAEKLG